MKRTGVVILLGWLGLVSSWQRAMATPADSLRIRHIVLVGNDHTRDFIILREMKSREGELYDERLLAEDRMRIQNLRLFTRVDIEAMPADEGVDLLVMVAERWYLFPYLILNTNERSWKKLSYGAGLAHQNLAGRNIFANAAFWFGYNPGFTLRYVDPWINRRHNLYFEGEIYSKKIKNKNSDWPEFDERHQGVTMTFGKRWGLHTYSAVRAGYRRVQLPAALVGRGGTDGMDHLPQAGVLFTYDRRDLREYARRGWYINLGVHEMYDGGRIHFQKYGIDVRRYQPLYRQVSLAGRLALDGSAGTIPLYERYFIGYQERVRGHFNEQAEGAQRLLSGLELRLPLLPIRYVDLGDDSSALGAYMNNLPFGVSWVLFADAAAVSDTWSHLRRQRFMQGFGGGLHIHLPYVELLRLEYAVDAHGHGQFISDLYVWF